MFSDRPPFFPSIIKRFDELVEATDGLVLDLNSIGCPFSSKSERLLLCHSKKRLVRFLALGKFRGRVVEWKENLPFKEKTFSAVTMYNSPNSMERTQLRKVFIEIFHVLESKGVLLLSIRSTRPLNKPQEADLLLNLAFGKTHPYEYHDIVEDLDMAGFSNITLEVSTEVANLPARWQRVHSLMVNEQGTTDATKFNTHVEKYGEALLPCLIIKACKT